MTTIVKRLFLGLAFVGVVSVTMNSCDLSSDQAYDAGYHIGYGLGTLINN